MKVFRKKEEDLGERPEKKPRKRKIKNDKSHKGRDIKKGNEKKKKKNKSFFNLSPKNKNDLYALFSGLILLLTIAMLMFPELIDYNNSIANLSHKRDQILNMENAINSNENLLASLSEQVKSKEKEVSDSNKKVQELKGAIRDTVFKLDVPSLLITLENVARENEIDILIDYSQFKEDIFAQADPLPSDEIPEIAPNDPSSENQNNSSENNLPDSNSSMPNQESNPLENDGGMEETQVRDKIYADRNKDQQIGEIETQYDGRNIASIPVFVSGNYTKVREFARILDNIDFLDPVYVHINSKGEEVDANFLLYIYYKDDLSF